MSRKSVEFFGKLKVLYIDNSSWIEEFFCGGKVLWMKVTKKAGRALSLLMSKDWPQTTPHTLPDTKSISKRIHLLHESSDRDKSPYNKE